MLNLRHPTRATLAFAHSRMVIGHVIGDPVRLHDFATSNEIRDLRNVVSRGTSLNALSMKSVCLPDCGLLYVWFHPSLAESILDVLIIR
jgi:hypothetical protein